MPIRFRCAYCNQLMGIARRKAGTVVRCPTCSGQVVVPATESDPSPSAKEGAVPNLFEQSDIDEVLRPRENLAESPQGGTVAAGAAARPAGAWGTEPEPMLPMDRLDRVAVAAPAPPGAVPSPPPGGLVLSSTRLTLLAVVAALLLGLVFGAGVVVGKFLL